MVVDKPQSTRVEGASIVMKSSEVILYFSAQLRGDRPELRIFRQPQSFTRVLPTDDSSLVLPIRR
jgi:hypothetical protein